MVATSPATIPQLIIGERKETAVGNKWIWLAAGIAAGWMTATWAPKFIPKLGR